LNDEIKAQILIGDDAETFVQSELGKTVLGMAQQDFEAAMHAFCEADLGDTRAVAKIQQEARVARALNQYLVELIQRGREAMTTVQQE
jgi:hypothetical protein